MAILKPNFIDALKVDMEEVNDFKILLDYKIICLSLVRWEFIFNYKIKYFKLIKSLFIYF